MSQQNKLFATPTPAPADVPVKRKRGRPRKDENLVKKDNSQLPVTPESDSIQNIQQPQVIKSTDVDDKMVGQLVSGVVEGTFDSGYFLCVRIGNSSNLLRGVVFHPGQVTPITSENDIAPNVRSYKRTDVPIPAFNQQTQANGRCVLPSASDIEKPVQLENQAHVAPDLVLPPELQSGGPFALNNQSASVVLPLTNMPKTGASTSLAVKSTPQQQQELGFVNESPSVVVPLTDVSKNDIGTSLGRVKVNEQQQQILEFGLSCSSTLPLPNMPNNVSSASLEVGKVVLQQNPEFGFENQSPPLLKNLKMVEQDEVMQVFEVPASAPIVDIFHGSKTNGQVPQVQNQVGESEVEMNQTSADEPQYLLSEPQTESGMCPIEPVQNETKSSNLEVQQTPVVTDSQSVPAESQQVEPELKTSEAVDNKLASSNLNLNQETLVAKPQSVTPEPISEPMDIESEKLIPTTNDSSRNIQQAPAEKDVGNDETSHNGNSLNDVADKTEVDSQSTQMTEEAIQAEPAEECGFSGRIDTHISGSSGHTTDMDFVLGDAIQPTQSQC